MKIACLQLAPELYRLDENMAKADALLEHVKPGDIDLLVLPEMAFTGKLLFSRPLQHLSFPLLDTATTSGDTE